MSVNSKTSKLVSRLCQSNNKMDGFFNVTHFDQVLSKEVSSSLEHGKKLGKTPQPMIKSGLIAQLQQPRSQRDYVSWLQGNKKWADITGFGSNVPVQGTFSNNWTNFDYFEPLENIFLCYRKLIPKKCDLTEYEYSYHLTKLVSAGYFPIIEDSTHLSLSNKRFKYGSLGFKDKENKCDYGAQINLCIDGLVNTPIDFTPETGKVHESTLFDLQLEELEKNYKFWIENQFNKKLNLLFIVDKGYNKEERFWDMTRANQYFLIPKKDRTMTKNQFEINFDEFEKNGIIELTVLKSNESDSLRWIIQKNKKFKSKWFSLLTNIWDLEPEFIVQIYSERWDIEEIFKWLKQYTLLKTPLVNSWEGFLLHILYSLILLMLLQFFLLLLNLPRWQENLTELWRQLRNNPLEQWQFGRLRIPYAVILGGMH